MNGKRGFGIFVLGIFLLFILFLNFVSAGFIGDFFKKNQITSEAIEMSEANSIATDLGEQNNNFSCFDNVPVFSIFPLSQEISPGGTLIYNLTIKNLDVNCSSRHFLITGDAPVVNDEMLWEIHFYIYGANHYEDGRQGSNFILDSGENVIMQIHVTSKENWSNGKYVHFSYLNYGIPGEQIYLNKSLKLNWTYQICSLPDCRNFLYTGYFDKDGCRVYLCPDCSSPICGDNELVMQTEEIDGNGCPIFECLPKQMHNESFDSNENDSGIGTGSYYEFEENSSEDFFICNSGCVFWNDCYDFGYRKNGMYCSKSGYFIEQFGDDALCDNNFECETNLCIDGQCVNSSFIQKVMNWFRNFFSGN